MGQCLTAQTAQVPVQTPVATPVRKRELESTPAGAQPASSGPKTGQGSEGTASSALALPAGTGGEGESSERRPAVDPKFLGGLTQRQAGC